MENNDPILTMAKEIGRITGVIEGSVRQSEEHSRRIDKAIDAMSNKIDEKQGRAIATAVVAEHVTSEHRKKSTAPAATIKISSSLLKKLAWIVGGAGIASGGGFWVWAFLEKIFGQ